MPISRFHIRSEHSLADPELHRAADKDDPEALLEAVAMAGLVGVLRQLGDLAQFAAEIFHDLHEEVMATAGRGHSLISRVQQLEAEVPALEKAFLSQTRHHSFFTNGGIEWHPNLRSEQNLVTRGDLPRFIMDSYEECRAPPRLFLLDKFDVAGAGACLKRYTDPSFFKVESSVTTVEVHREKRIHKVKQKKVSKPRNGTKPEVVSSHANSFQIFKYGRLHQLFLEERIENACNDPARLVKLKKKQLNGSAVDSKTGKSYMEKIFENSSPDHKMVCEASITPHPLRSMFDADDNGITVLEISSLSSVKRSPGYESKRSSPLNGQELELKPYSEIDRVRNGDFVQVHEDVLGAVTHKTPLNHPKVPDERQLVVDEQKNRECILDGYHSDDVTSEVDDYMDALASIEELETEIECRPKKSLFHIQKTSDSNGKEEHQLQGQFSDSQSFGDSLTSEEIDSVDQDRNDERTEVQAQLSDSQSTRSSNASDDSRSSRRVRIAERTQLQTPFSDSQSIGNSSISEIEYMPSNQLDQNVELQSTHCGGFVMHDKGHVYGEDISGFGPDASVSCLMDSGHSLLSLDPGPLSSMCLPIRTQSGETQSGPVETHQSLEDDEDRKSLVESVMKDDACSIVSSNNKSLDSLDVCDPCVSSNALEVFNDLNLAQEDEYGNHSAITVLQEESANKYSSAISDSGDMGFQGENPIFPSMKADLNLGTKLALGGRDFNSENGVNEIQHISEDLSPALETPQISNITEELSDFTLNQQDEPHSAESEVFCSEQQSTFEDIQRMLLADEKGGSKVEDDVHIKYLSSLDNNKQDNLVFVNDVSTEKVHSDQAFSALHLVDSAENGASSFNSLSSGFVSSPSRNASDLSSFSSHRNEIKYNEADLTKVYVGLNSEKRVNKLESSSDLISSPAKRLTDLEESTFADSHEKEMEVNEVLPHKYLTALVAPRVVDQLEIGAADIQSNPNRSVPCDPCHSEICNNIQEERIQNLSAVSEMKVVDSSSELDSERSESVCLSQNDVQNNKESLSSPSFNQLKPETHSEMFVESPVNQRDAEVQLRNDGYHSLEKFQFHHQSSSQLEQLRIHPDEQSSFDFSSKSFLQETSPTKHVMHSLHPLIPELTNNHEEIPPMPPLPPMQWRMSKVQHSSLVSQREEIEATHASLQPIQPVKPNDKSQFGLSTSDRDTILYQNPFLPVMAVESSKLQRSPGFLAGLPEHSVAIPLQFPIMINKSNSQYNYLVMDKSHHQNPFLTLPVVSTSRPPHGYVIASEGETVQSASACTSIPPAERSVSGSYPISPQDKPSASPSELTERSSLEVKDESGESHLMPPTELAASGNDLTSARELITPRQLTEETSSLEVKTFEQSSIYSERKQGDPSISPMAPPGIEVGQPNDSLLPSKGGTTLPLDKSSRTPEFDNKMPNGKPKNKVVRPESPIIDIAAALDRSKLRKVSERVIPPKPPKLDERDSLLEQIRSKSFNLRPAAATRPIMQGPKTNLRVAAILEKANSIRQALAGSDEDDDTDSWSDS
nr:protein SCAR2 isoform X1 [Arachis hypogaea]